MCLDVQGTEIAEFVRKEILDLDSPIFKKETNHHKKKEILFEVQFYVFVSLKCKIKDGL